MNLSFDELWERLQNSEESVEIEAKRARDVGSSILETISAYSNEPGRGGGYLLLGIEEDKYSLFPKYEISGVPKPDKVQTELATQCRELFSTPVRPRITTEVRDGKTVLVVFICEAQPHEKPVFILSKGLPKGAFRRIASTDQHCTEEDIELFYILRGHKPYDKTPLPDVDLDDFDPQAIAAYRRNRADVKADASELALSDEELLYALSATTRHEGQLCATLAGLMLFGKETSLRRNAPMTRVDYIVVEGREWVRDPSNRYQGVELRGPLLTLIPQVVSLVMTGILKTFALSEDKIYRREVPLLPRDVVREVVVNALMHRSYRKRQPVQIIRYANRIEIRNPGHSLKADDLLGQPGSVPRNEDIATAIHEVGFAETKGTGIRAVRQAMAAANLSAPFFESNREADEFVATLLLHHFFSEDDVKWLAGFKDCHLSDEEARSLIVLREVGVINNAYYRSLTGMDTLAASKSLQRLRDLKLLGQKGKGSATYYVPGERLAGSLPESLPTEFDSVGNGLSTESDSVDKEPALLAELPELLRFAVAKLGRRTAPAEVKLVVRALCEWRTLRLQEIASVLSRNSHYVLTQYLRPMLSDGELSYLYPDEPNHPQQAYSATKAAHAKRRK